MSACTACTAPLRERARFCTRCGAPATVEVNAARAVEAPVRIDEVPARIPVSSSPTVPARSAAAIGALVAGIAPLVISVVGNLIAAELSRGALTSGAGTEGAWAPVLLAIAVVFVLTAGSLTVCGILGARALRETASGALRGRGLAIAGLTTGGVNLVLWIAGLVVTVSSLSSVVV